MIGNGTNQAFECPPGCVRRPDGDGKDDAGMEATPRNERERKALEAFMDGDAAIDGIGLVIRMVEAAFLAGYRANASGAEEDRSAVEIVEIRQKAL